MQLYQRILAGIGGGLLLTGALSGCAEKPENTQPTYQEALKSSRAYLQQGRPLVARSELLKIPDILDKLDEEGRVLWKKVYEGNLPDDLAYLVRVVETEKDSDAEYSLNEIEKYAEKAGAAIPTQVPKLRIKIKEQCIRKNVELAQGPAENSEDFNNAMRYLKKAQTCATEGNIVAPLFQLREELYRRTVSHLLQAVEKDLNQENVAAADGKLNQIGSISERAGKPLPEKVGKLRKRTQDLCSQSWGEDVCKTLLKY